MSKVIRRTAGSLTSFLDPEDRKFLAQVTVIALWVLGIALMLGLSIRVFDLAAG